MKIGTQEEGEEVKYNSNINEMEEKYSLYRVHSSIWRERTNHSWWINRKLERKKWPK